MNIDELKKILFNNGIVGAGGAGFPAYAKLNKDADVLILNCAECEPLMMVDKQLLQKKTSEILKAFSLIAETLGVKTGFVAVKSVYTNAVKSVENEIKNYKNLELKLLPNVYPMGDEVALVYEVTGRIVPEGSIPISVGAVVMNVETVYNVYKAVYENQPVTDKYVTVNGEVKNPVTVKVPIGVTVGKLIELAGGVTTDKYEIIMGGPMMGRIVTADDIITKTTKGILVLKSDSPVITKRHISTSQMIKRAMSVCSQCQMCTDICPRHLLGHSIKPNKVMRALASGVVTDIEAYTMTMLCCECGLCEMYSCHQGLSPRSLIKELKTKLKQNGVRNPFKGAPNQADDMREERKVPMPRLIARLGLSEYKSLAAFDDKKINVSKVKILLSQHIGIKAVPIVKIGDTVNKGDVIGDIPEGKLGTKIHSSITGKVANIDGNSIIIEKDNSEFHEERSSEN